MKAGWMVAINASIFNLKTMLSIWITIRSSEKLTDKVDEVCMEFKSRGQLWSRIGLVYPLNLSIVYINSLAIKIGCTIISTAVA